MGGKAPNETRFVRVDDKVKPGTIREAVRDGEQGATDWGFYDVPREASIDDIADEMGLDGATVPDNLQPAERNLLSQQLAVLN